MGTTMTRGPLPARVYWTRRALLLLLVLALVWTTSHVFGGDPQPEARAKQSAATTKPSSAKPTADATDTGTTYGPQVTTGKRHKKKKVEPIEVAPEGPCLDDDVVSEPSVARAYAGRDVTLRFKLHTIQSAACTWHISPTTVT